MANRAISQSSSFELEEERASFKESILKKFKFLSTLKNFVVSKIRRNRYDMSKAQSPQPEVSIISYEQRTFEDVERELEAQWNHTLQVNRNVLEALRATLNPGYDDNMRPNVDMELLEIVEKTFARQMDIFEIILQQINSKNDSNKMEVLRELRRAANDKSFDLNYLIGHLVAEIQRCNGNPQHMQIMTDKTENNPGASGNDEY